MKKYGMIFASVIFTLLIMLIPNQKVNAEELEVKYLNYDDFVTSYDKFSSILDTTRDYLLNYSNDYYYFIMLQQNSIKAYLVKKSDNVQISTELRKTDYSSIYTYTGSTSKKISYIELSANLSNFDTNFNTFKLKVDNLSFEVDSALIGSTGIYNDYSEIKDTALILYDTNFDNYILSSSSIYALDVGGTIIQPGEKIPTYYKQKFSKKIDISSVFACDINGKDMEYVTIDFSDYNVSNYSYQYGIKRYINGDIIWYDINNINNYVYNFNEYYNETIIYGRVLDNEGNEIALNQYTINNVELPKFGLSISSGLACPISNYDGNPEAEIIAIDFSNIYFENYKYYYSYDSNTMYEIDVTSNDLVYQITEYLYNFIYFYVYDENDNLIYYTYNDVSSDERLGFFPNDYNIRHKVFITESPACDMNGNKQIIIKMDFSNITKYVNHYNFDVIINGENLGSILYHEVIIDELNDLRNYNIEIYIDTFLYYSRDYKVGYLLNNEPIQGEFDDKEFDDLYDEILDIVSSEDIKNNETLFNLFINSLNKFRDIIVDIFNDITYLFSHLNPILRYFYISVFSLILFSFLIRFIL